VLVSTAISITPEVEPTLAADRRSYLLANRSGSSIEHAKVTVTSTAAVELTASLASRTKVFIKSLDGNPDIYLGPSGVSSTTGYLLREKEEEWLDLTPDAAIYAIAASGSADVRVLESGP
jgi:hypothetical protein